MLHFRRSIPILFVLVLLASLVPAAASATERGSTERQREDTRSRQYTRPDSDATERDTSERNAPDPDSTERDSTERATAERQSTQPEPSSREATSGNYATQLESQFLSLINQYRQSNGLESLSRNSALDTASRLHSKDMAVNGYFSHTSMDGRSPWTRMTQAGYTCNGAKGENIAAGFSSAQAAFNAWRNSPGHNRNMLSDSFRAIGIGVYYDASSPYGYYWTTDFGACR